MTISEWLLLVQTVILAATGLVVLWYTRETRLIRLETARQNQLISQQLKLVLQKEVRDRREAVLKAQPVFTGWGGMLSGANAQLHVTNDGAAASDLSVRPLGDFTATVSPSFVKAGQTLYVNLHGLPDGHAGEDLQFVLGYTDSLGTPREKIICRHSREQRFSEQGPDLD